MTEEEEYWREHDDKLEEKRDSEKLDFVDVLNLLKELKIRD